MKKTRTVYVRKRATARSGADRDILDRFAERLARAEALLDRRRESSDSATVEDPPTPKGGA